MTPLLKEARSRGQLYKRARKATEPETLAWLEDIYKLEWHCANEIKRRHSADAWYYYKNLKGPQLREVALLELALAQLAKAWETNVPAELTARRRSAKPSEVIDTSNPE